MKTTDAQLLIEVKDLLERLRGQMIYDYGPEDGLAYEAAGILKKIDERIIELEKTLYLTRYR